MPYRTPELDIDALLERYMVLYSVVSSPTYASFDEKTPFEQWAKDKISNKYSEIWRELRHIRNRLEDYYKERVMVNGTENT